MTIRPNILIDQYKTEWEILHNKYKDILFDDDIMSIDDLKSLGYTTFLNYWFHPNLNIRTRPQAEEFYKLAALDNVNRRNVLSRYVYYRDKHATLRGLSAGQLDRCDSFIASIEGGKTIRFNGTKHGAGKYSIDKSEKFRESNKEFLRVLHSGPDHLLTPISCISTGICLENIGYSHTKGKYMQVDSYEIHHCVFTASSSYYFDTTQQRLIRKSRELSELISSKNYKDFTTNEISELLGIIMLSANEHTKLHKLETSDGINRWKLRLDSAEMTSLPFHWLSEINYNRLLTWIYIRCKNVDIYTLPTYEDFMKIHSLPYLQNTLSLESDSSQQTKTDPTAQNTSPCTAMTSQP